MDLARCFAIIGVIEVHTFHWIPGSYGVPLFFVVSGYVLSDSAKSKSKREYLITRWARLWPMAAIMSAIYFLRFNNILELGLTLALLHIFFLYQQSFPGSWSISSEWIYALVNLFLVRLTRNSRFKVFIGLVFFVLLLDLLRHNVEGLEQNWFYGSLLLIGNTSYFVAGNLLRDQSVTGIPTTVIIGILSPIFFLSINNNVYDSIYFVAVLLLFIGCLKVRIKPGLLQKSISYVGKRTYSLFCTHFILISLSQSLGFYSLESQTNRMYRILDFAIIFLLSLSISHFSYKLIERPSLKLIVRLFYSNSKRGDINSSQRN